MAGSTTGSIGTIHVPAYTFSAATKKTLRVWPVVEPDVPGCLEARLGSSQKKSTKTSSSTVLILEFTRLMKIVTLTLDICRAEWVHTLDHIGYKALSPYLPCYKIISCLHSFLQRNGTRLGSSVPNVFNVLLQTLSKRCIGLRSGPSQHQHVQLHLHIQKCEILLQSAVFVSVNLLGMHQTDFMASIRGWPCTSCLGGHLIQSPCFLRVQHGSTLAWNSTTPFLAPQSLLGDSDHHRPMRRFFRHIAHCRRSFSLGLTNAYKCSHFKSLQIT